MDLEDSFWPVAPVHELCHIADIGTCNGKPMAAFRKLSRTRTIGHDRTYKDLPNYMVWSNRLSVFIQSKSANFYLKWLANSREPRDYRNL